MKSKLVLSLSAAVALLVGLNSAAIADDKYNGELGSNWLDHVTSTKSGTQVSAELRHAREQGWFGVGSEWNYPVLSLPASVRTRNEVIAEYENYVRSGRKALGAATTYSGA